MCSVPSRNWNELYEATGGQTPFSYSLNDYAGSMLWLRPELAQWAQCQTLPAALCTAERCMKALQTAVSWARCERVLWRACGVKCVCNLCNVRHETWEESSLHFLIHPWNNFKWMGFHCACHQIHLIDIFLVHPVGSFHPFLFFDWISNTEWSKFSVESTLACWSCLPCALSDSAI